MADKNQDDEYQFADLDTIEPEAHEEDMDNLELPPEEQNGGRKNTVRNALVVITLVIIAMLAYKFLGTFFSPKTTPPEPTPPAIQPITQTPVVTPPTQPVTPPPEDNQLSAEAMQKLAAMELSQQNLRSEVTTLSNQLGGINANISDLTDKINTLSQTVGTLAAKVDEQSQQIAVLTVRAQPKPAPKVVRKAIPLPVYYIQAVIPGRAWLIATNGSTLTVREGTIIPGLGVVKLIDANQGRVLLSTGKIIRFSQQDS